MFETGLWREIGLEIINLEVIWMSMMLKALRPDEILYCENVRRAEESEGSAWASKALGWGDGGKPAVHSEEEWP